MKHLSDSPEFKTLQDLFDHPIKKYILDNYTQIPNPEPSFMSGPDFDRRYVRHVATDRALYTWEVSFWEDPKSNFFQISKSSQGYGIYGMYGYPYLHYRGDIDTVEDFKALERILKIRI